MTKPGSIDLVIDPGTEFRRVLRIKNKNLTGHAARLQMKDTITGTVRFDLSTTNGRITLAIDVADTVLTLVIASADTALVTWTNAIYDLVTKSPAGEGTRWLRGDVFVERGVTTIP